MQVKRHWDPVQLRLSPGALLAVLTLGLFIMTSQPIPATPITYPSQKCRYIGGVVGWQSPTITSMWQPTQGAGPQKRWRMEWTKWQGVQQSREEDETILTKNFSNGLKPPTSECWWLVFPWNWHDIAPEKWMVGRRSFPIGFWPIFCGEVLVAGRANVMDFQKPPNWHDFHQISQVFQSNWGQISWV